jgi:hypothetical protein
MTRGVQHGLAWRGQLPARGEEQEHDFRSGSDCGGRYIKMVQRYIGEGVFELVSEV